MSDANRPDRALDRFPHHPPGGSPHGTERGTAGLPGPREDEEEAADGRVAAERRRFGEPGLGRASQGR